MPQIYKTKNLLDGKIYIGQDSRDNPKYFGSGFHLKRAIKKYGRQYFIKEVLAICTVIELDSLEEFYIKKFDARNPNIGYNIAPGGEGFKSGAAHPFFGKEFSVEHRANMSKNHAHNRRGVKLSYEERLKLVNNAKRGSEHPSFGKHHSDATKLLISLANKGKIISVEHRAMCSLKNTGRKLSEDAKRRISVANTGKVLSEHTKQLLSLARTGKEGLHRYGTAAPMFGKKHTEETKRKMGRASHLRAILVTLNKLKEFLLLNLP